MNLIGSLKILTGRFRVKVGGGSWFAGPGTGSPARRGPEGPGNSGSAEAVTVTAAAAYSESQADSESEWGLGLGRTCSGSGSGVTNGSESVSSFTLQQHRYAS
jgi:hypothetical protein